MTRAEQLRAAFFGEEPKFELREQSEAEKAYWKSVHERKEKQYVTAEQAYQYIVERGRELCSRCAAPGCRRGASSGVQAPCTQTGRALYRLDKQTM